MFPYHISFRRSNEAMGGMYTEKVDLFDSHLGGDHLFPINIVT